MKYRIVQYRENIYENFWLVPLLMSLSAFLLAVIMLYLDHSFLLPNLKGYLNYFVGVESARESLSIIASSVITVTSVTFSIIVLTLSIASNQLGPRLLPNFMRQITTQIVLGVFIGTFIYSLIVLHAMSISTQYYNLPYLAVFVGMILGLTSFFLLIYVVHFVCHVIQIDNVLEFLVNDLILCLKRQLPDITDKKINRKQHKSISNRRSESKNNLSNKYCKTIKNYKAGYIQVIDYQTILNIATEFSGRIHISTEPGDFIVSDMPIMTIYSSNEIHDDIKNRCLNAVTISIRRSTVQDIKFAFEELSEIALRALSPGVNNPFTAIHCLDKMIEGFAALSKKQMLPRIMYDEKNEIRVVRKILSYEDIVSTAINRLRQQAQLDLAVTTHLLSMFARLLQLKMPNALHQALIKQAKIIYRDSSKEKMDETDRSDLESHYQKIIKIHEVKKKLRTP